jgi:hypothetical protein
MKRSKMRIVIGPNILAKPYPRNGKTILVKIDKITVVHAPRSTYLAWYLFGSLGFREILKR